MNKEGLIKDKYEILIKEFQTILSFLYLFIIMVGMIFSYHKYKKFDLNIFEYATIFDFLILPFKDSIIIIFSLISILLVGLALYIPVLLKKIQKKENVKPKSKFQLMLQNSKYKIPVLTLSLIYLFYNYSSVLANTYGKKQKQKIISQSEKIIELITNDTEKGKIVGKTENFLFLYQKEKVKIIPISSIKLIITNNNIK